MDGDRKKSSVRKTNGIASKKAADYMS